MAPRGTKVFVPAGTPHTYRVSAEPSRYLTFLTPRLSASSPPRSSRDVYEMASESLK